MKTFNKNLALLLGGQFISQLGDKFYALALAFWVLRTTGSPALMGTVLFASMVPSIVLGFFIGGIIDKYNRKAILVAADVLRGIVITAVVMLYYLKLLDLAGIIIAQVLLSIASAFFNPATLAVVPQIVQEAQLGKANSKSQFLYGAANIIGPVLGGLAVSYIGYAFVFAFNALSFFVSAILEALMNLPATHPVPTGKKHAHERLAQGYSYIFSKKRILVILGVVAIVHFFVGAIQVVMPVLANALPGAGARNLGYVETASGVGVLAMALVLNAANLRGREEKCMFGGIAALGAVLTAIGLLQTLGVTSVIPYLAIFFLFSAAVILISTNYMVILQQNVDNAMAGRVFGVISSVGNFSLPVSMLITGFALNYISTGSITLFCGVAVILVCVALALVYKAQKPVMKMENPL